jgi:hypothetical protein
MYNNQLVSVGEKEDNIRFQQFVGSTEEKTMGHVFM